MFWWNDILTGRSMHCSVEPKGWTALTSLNSVKRTEAMISKKPKRPSFDEAMNEAFQVIFENLKEIERKNKRNWDKNKILRKEEAVLLLQFSAKRHFIEYITKREICLPLYSNQVKFAESRELNCLRKQRPQYWARHNHNSVWISFATEYQLK